MTGDCISHFGCLPVRPVPKRVHFGLGRTTNINCHVIQYLQRPEYLE